MKIYSLQEENEKLNASRGIVQPGINHDMFNVKKTAAPAPQRQTMRQQTPQRQTPQRQTMQQQTPQRQTAQRQPRQTPKRPLGLLVGWIIFMIFLFLISYISDMF